MSDANQLVTVYVIDDDARVRRALARVFKAAGFTSIGFPSTAEFMAADIASETACVLTDMHITGDAPEKLPARLRARNLHLPVIFISADDSEQNRAKVNRAGGVGFFRKPVDDQALIDAVRFAVRGAGRQGPAS